MVDVVKASGGLTGSRRRVPELFTNTQKKKEKKSKKSRVKECSEINKEKAQCQTGCSLLLHLVAVKIAWYLPVVSHKPFVFSVKLQQVGYLGKLCVPTTERKRLREKRIVQLKQRRKAQIGNTFLLNIIFSERKSRANVNMGGKRPHHTSTQSHESNALVMLRP